MNAYALREQYRLIAETQGHLLSNIRNKTPASAEGIKHYTHFVYMPLRYKLMMSMVALEIRLPCVGPLHVIRRDGVGACAG